MRHGWYVTGDIAAIDEDGFIRITDRLSRFSKIGGEMVPHMKVEEMINEVLGSPPPAVTALPDEQRGEKLVVFYAQERHQPGRALGQTQSTPICPSSGFPSARISMSSKPFRSSAREKPI